MIFPKLADARFACAVIAGFSLFALAAALTAQYGFGMTPCALCHWQRLPYGITVIMGLAGFAAAGNRPKISALLVFLSGFAFLAGTGLAFYHTGVEQHWWKSALEGCKLDFSAAEGSLLDKIESTPAVPCDKIPWADPLFHLSMAVWNMIVSAGLSLLSFLSSVLIVRKANGVL